MMRKWKAELLLVALLVLGSLAPPEAVDAMGGGQETISLPVIMYHSIYDDPAGSSAYVLSPAAFEADIQWLAAHGYTPVRASDVLAWWKNGAEMPEKPVMLTFDDGFYNYLPNLLPILTQYALPAVVSVVGEYAEAAEGSADRHPAYAYLNWADLQNLLESGLVEIGNHSYGMHGLEPRLGVSRMKGEPEEAYRAVLEQDTAQMEGLLAAKLGIRPQVYAFPYGAMSRGTGNILRELGYEMLLTCEERPNTLTRGEENLPKLGRYNRDARMTTEQFMNKAMH